MNRTFEVFDFRGRLSLLTELPKVGAPSPKKAAEIYAEARLQELLDYPPNCSSRKADAHISTI